MRLLKIQDHDSTGYAPRTRHNANSADVTIAVAIDFSTAGERLTKSLALEGGEDRYFPIYITEDPIRAARRLYLHMKKNDFKSINVAGNGIYTLSDNMYTQAEVNMYLYKLLSPIHEHLGLEHIVSGGQSGVDLAGGVAATSMDIRCQLTLPKGYKQRWEDGVDRFYSKRQIRDQVRNGVDELRRNL
ncbi:putative molybdenum cofactor carrier [Vibrio phage 1.121.O._10N.286.46.C4]|nr:putative molybdenum cofactor carrier [Vibrio phage 1.121.O._10N.286.46.C4]